MEDLIIILFPRLVLLVLSVMLFYSYYIYKSTDALIFGIIFAGLFLLSVIYQIIKKENFFKAWLAP